MESGFIDHNGVTSAPCPAGSDCPTDCELKEMLSGTLDGPRADLVLQLSERCEQCDRRLTALERFTASRSSQFTLAPASDNIGSQDAGCRLMLDRLVALWEREQSSESLPRFSDAFSAKLSPTGETSSNQLSEHGNPFGPYVVLDFIAAGGFGRVDRALDTRLGRIVALKRIQGETKGTAEVLARFQIEATTTAQLSHPGIVRVYEAGQIEGIPFIAMEFVAGTSLSAIDFQTPPSPRRCAEICRDVALAIASAHEAGVIHRDLKPSNILIDHNGSPRVTDFGLAKHVQRNEELTTTGQLLGTPSYMAPEQARGAHGQVGRHSDVYSLGAVLYFLLTGQAPFRGATIVETLRQVTESDPAPPRAINPKTPRDLEILCLKCLEKRPQDRIPSATEFARQLSLFLAGEPITFRPPRLDERVVRWCRRRPLATAVAVAIPLTIFCALLALFWHRHAAKSREALRISTELTATLEERRFTAETFDRLEVLEAQLFELAPELSTQVSTRVVSALHESVNSGLGRNELTDAEFLELEKQIAFLQSRSPELASSLSRALQRRRSDWNWKVRLDDPTTGYESFIDPSLVVPNGKGLRMVAPTRLVLDQAGRNWVPPTLPTRIACEEDLEIEIQFSDDWPRSTAIGVKIGDDSHAYCEFMLRPLRYSNGTSAFPLADADRDRVEILAQILVSNQIVRQRSIDLSVLKNGPLRIHARREGRRLYFRLNDLPILTFTHAFLGLSPDAHISLRLDAATSITALHVRQKSCDDDGVFREADRQYAVQRYEEALTRYVEISQPGYSSARRQEATYKRALCLLALDRPAEAVNQLSSLALDDGGEHWPSLAAFLLWKLHLDENHEEEARSTANYWHSRFQQPRVDFIPSHFWTSITSHYLTNVRKLSRVTRFDESFSPMLGTLADIDRRVGEHTAGTPDIQVGIANLYRQLEMNEEALNLLNATLPACSTNFLKLNNRILANRVLRQLDRPDEALAVLEQTIQETNSATSDSWFVKAHACTLEQLGRSNESESLVETQLEALGLSSNSLHAIVDLAMIKGVLARRRGDHQAALAAFEHGWKAGRPLLDSRQSLASSAVLNAIIHGCYCDGITQKDIQTLLENSDFRENPLLVVAKSAVNSETLRRSLLLTWKSPRGLELAADHAFDRLTVHDRFRQPAALMAIGLISQSLMGGEVDETFSDTLHEHFLRAIDDHLLEKSIGVSQVIQAGLAWKGTTNAFGWAGLKTTLPESQRQLLALILAYRYARIGAAENDRLLLWDEAIAGPDSRLSEVAKLGLQSSRDGTAVLILANSTQRSVVIQLRRISSDAIEYVALGVPTDGATSRKTIQIPAGDYMLITTANGSSHEKILGPFSFLPVTRRYVAIQQID